jgi:hypothetical protein
LAEPYPSKWWQLVHRNASVTGGYGLSRGIGCRVEFTFDSVGSTGSVCAAQSLGGCDFAMIILGIVLLIIGFIAAVPIIWSIGVIMLVIGLVFMILGSLGHAIGGRRHVF